jgi:hypothetical protein
MRFSLLTTVRMCGFLSSTTYVSIRQHTSAYAYVSIRQLVDDCADVRVLVQHHLRQHTSAYVSIRIRQHPSAC